MESAKKISVTLPPDLLASVDKLVKTNQRSKLIETALRDYIAKETPKNLNKRDIEIINANADIMNKNSLETLEIAASSFFKNKKVLEISQR
jgi:metal-responsive CopG/Arc/MetJ family transcriptional regulator